MNTLTFAEAEAKDQLAAARAEIAELTYELSSTNAEIVEQAQNIETLKHFHKLEIETLEHAVKRQAAVIAKARHLIRSTLDAPTLIDPAVNCRNLTRTLQEVEAALDDIGAGEGGNDAT